MHCSYSGTTKTPSKPTPSSGSKLQVPSKLGRTSAGGQSGMMKSTSTASLASDHGGAETEKVTFVFMFAHGKVLHFMSGEILNV